MKARALFFTLLLLTVFTTGSEIAKGQGVDMDKQLEARKHLDKHIQDNDNDRHGSLFSSYLMPRTGDPRPAFVDSVQLNAFHYSYVEGLSPVEAYLGTQAGPYLSMSYFDRPVDRWNAYFFTLPYRHLMWTGERLRFFDTKVPYSYLYYLNSGTGDEQEQNFQALLTTNIGPNFNIGGEVRLDKAGGYYAGTASANVTYRVFGSYTKDKYEAYLSIGNTNVVNQENGGITDMKLVTNPDEIQQGRRKLLPKDIPTKYSRTWNRVIFGEGRLHHRYRFGYYEELDDKGDVVKKGESDEGFLDRLFGKKDKSRKTEAQKDSIAEKEPLTSEVSATPEVEQKEPSLAATDTIPPQAEQPKVVRRVGQSVGQAPKEDPNSEEAEKKKPKKRFVPVAAIYHDVDYTHGASVFVSQDPNLLKLYPNPILPKPEGARYYPHDNYNMWRVSNALGVELIEGFKSWVKMGMSAFVGFDYEEYHQPLISHEDAERLDLPYEELTKKEHTTFVGGRVSSDSFRFLKYYVWGQVGVEGARAGDIDVRGNIGTSFKLFGKEIALDANASFLNTIPTYFLKRYKGTLHEWDNDFVPTQTIRIGGDFRLPFTGTHLYANTEMIQNPLYAGQDAKPNQKASNFRVIGVGMDQKLTWKVLNLELTGLWQKSSDEEVAPLPGIALYGNFYFQFLIAKVMDLQIGVDAKWHTKYYAPYYEPTTRMFVPQKEIEIGGKAPLMTAYANAHLSRTRFFVRYYNVGALLFRPDNFTMPYYPTYPPLFQMGVIVDLKN